MIQFINNMKYFLFLNFIVSCPLLGIGQVTKNDKTLIPNISQEGVYLPDSARIIFIEREVFLRDSLYSKKKTFLSDKSIEFINKSEQLILTMSSMKIEFTNPKKYIRYKIVLNDSSSAIIYSGRLIMQLDSFLLKEAKIKSDDTFDIKWW